MRVVLRPVLGLALLGGCQQEFYFKATEESPVVEFVYEATDTDGPVGPGAPEVNPLESEEGILVQFLVRVTDDGPTENLEVTWSHDGQPFEEVWFGPDGDLYDLTTSTLAVGERSVIVNAKDAAGHQTQAEHVIRIVDAFAGPDISVKFPRQNAQLDERSHVDFVAHVEDDEDPAEQLRVTIESDVDGELCAPGVDRLGDVRCSKNLTSGRHTITFIATDSDDNEAREQVVVDVGDGFDRDDDKDLFTENQGDCDDFNASIHPNAVETCDGLDQDCDLVIDNDTVCYDDDGDGFTELQGDCNDAKGDIRPQRSEIWYDGVDQNCDGRDDYDQDRDGVRSDRGDCDDADANIYPGGVEICNGVDDDCDGCKDGGIGQDFYPDLDGDGWGSGSTAFKFCAPPVGAVDATTCGASSAVRGLHEWSANNADCYDDTRAANRWPELAYPGQSAMYPTSRGDGSFDYNCDGELEKSDPSVDLWACGQVILTLGDVQFYMYPGWVGGSPLGHISDPPRCGEAASWAGNCDFTRTYLDGSISGGTGFTPTEVQSIDIDCN